MMLHPLTSEMMGTQGKYAFNTQESGGEVRENHWHSVCSFLPLETQFHHLENGDNNTSLTLL